MPIEARVQGNGEAHPQSDTTPKASRSMAILAAAAVNPAPTDPIATRERHHNEGPRRRLTAAFEALGAGPALGASRNHVMRLFESGQPAAAAVVAAVEP